LERGFSRGKRPETVSLDHRVRLHFDEPGGIDEAADLDDLLARLDDCELTREERRNYESRLRELRIFEGVTCSLDLAFDHHSRLYVYQAQPDWYEDFLGVEDEIVSRMADEEDLDEGDSLGGYFSKN